MLLTKTAAEEPLPPLSRRISYGLAQMQHASYFQTGSSPLGVLNTVLRMQMLVLQDTRLLLQFHCASWQCCGTSGPQQCWLGKMAIRTCLLVSVQLACWKVGAVSASAVFLSQPTAMARADIGQCGPSDLDGKIPGRTMMHRVCQN